MKFCPYQETYLEALEGKKTCGPEFLVKAREWAEKELRILRDCVVAFEGDDENRAEFQVGVTRIENALRRAA